MSNVQNISKNQLTADIQNMGVYPGDMIYVHSSIKKIGLIEHGIDTLINSFLTVLGENGTLAVPTHSLSFPGRGVPPFDAASSPSLVGTFSELVRKYPGAERSLHASHSSAAIGKFAVYLTRDHNLSEPFHFDSPLNRLYRLNGKILLLGVTHTANTMLHLAEYLSGVEYVSLPYDKSWGACTHSLSPDGSVMVTRQLSFPGCSSEFARFEQLAPARERIKYGKIGNAPCQLIEAKSMVEIAIRAIKQEPDIFLCKNPNCPCCPSRRSLLHGRLKT